MWIQNKEYGHGNSSSSYRGRYESLTYAANKEVIANLSEINIDISGVKVKMFVKEIIKEEEVICNGRSIR